MEYPRFTVAEVLDNSIDALIRYNYNGLLGVETATAYWGLSTFNPGIPIFMVNDNSMGADGYFARCALSYLFVPDVNTQNIKRLSENLFITDKEQTICDMIRYNRHEFHLFESVLSAYEDGEVDVERMERLARQYHILDRLHQIHTEALREMEEEV